MPYASKKQARFMRMCAHNPKHAKGKCPPKKVTGEFERAEQAEHPRAAALRGLMERRG